MNIPLIIVLCVLTVTILFTFDIIKLPTTTTIIPTTTTIIPTTTTIIPTTTTIKPVTTTIKPTIIPTTTTIKPITTTIKPITTTIIPTTTTIIPTNAIYFKNPINLVNNMNLKLQILYNLANKGDTSSLSINFSNTPTTLECISSDSIKNSVNTPIKNNDILRLHETNGDDRYISNYNSIEECPSRDCIFNYEDRIALGFSPSDSLKVFAFLDDYGKYKSYININGGYYPNPVPTEHLDFTIICFDSLDNQIMDNNYIVTSNTKFRLKMRNMYLDGNSSCIKTAYIEKWCGLNLVPTTVKTPSQLFSFINV